MKPIFSVLTPLLLPSRLVCSTLAREAGVIINSHPQGTDPDPPLILPLLQVFVPDYKWGPLSFMRLTHEAFRGAIPRLLAVVRARVDIGSGAVPQVSGGKRCWTVWKIRMMIDSSSIC